MRSHETVAATQVGGSTSSGTSQSTANSVVRILAEMTVYRWPVASRQFISDGGRDLVHVGDDHRVARFGVRVDDRPRGVALGVLAGPRRGVREVGDDVVNGVVPFCEPVQVALRSAAAWARRGG